MAGRLGRWIARHRRVPWVGRVARLCRRYLDAYGNLDYDQDSNGEVRVLEVLGRFQPAVIIDAGANVGDWSLAAARACANAQVHAFEISPPTFRSLRARAAAEPRIHCHAIGLSEAAGSIQLRHYPDAPVLSTTTAYPHALPFEMLEVPVAAGAEQAAALGLDHIDFLKIDVEGMEEAVLRGFDPMLREGRIELVQFEYGRVNILNGFLLQHSARFFEERGYRVGKIYPDHVDFRPVGLEDEDFIGPNYLACRASRADLIAALQGA